MDEAEPSMLHVSTRTRGQTGAQLKYVLPSPHGLCCSAEAVQCKFIFTRRAKKRDLTST